MNVTAVGVSYWLASPVESTVINMAGATVTFDGEQVSVKHRGMGTCSAFVQQILSVDMEEPRFMKPGVLRIVTTGAAQRGLMPKDPWTLRFTQRQVDEVRVLYGQLVRR